MGIVIKKRHKLKVFTCLALSVFISVVLLSRVDYVVANVQVALLAQESSDGGARMEAQRLFDEGDKLYKQGTAESLQQAIRKWKEALVLYQHIGDKGWQAVSLLGIGRIYNLLGDKQQALKFFNQSLPLWIEVGDKATQAKTLNLCRLQRLQRLQIKPLTLLSFSTTYRVVT